VKYFLFGWIFAEELRELEGWRMAFALKHPSGQRWLSPWEIREQWENRIQLLTSPPSEEDVNSDR
jgi:hypothetical protein